MQHELDKLVRQPAIPLEKRFAWLRGLRPCHSADDVADALIRAAGELEIAETRIW